MSSLSQRSVLVLTAGELGMAVLRGLLNRKESFQVSVLLRPNTIEKGTEDDPRLAELKALGIANLVPGDIQADEVESLASTFAEYDIVIACTGFLGGPGTQMKLAQCAIVASKEKRRSHERAFRYVPWQFGVDYDVLSKGKSLGLFDEQCAVRDLIRSEAEQSQTDSDDKKGQLSWTIVSTGIFTSFLFEDFFGVVQRPSKGESSVTMRALGDWDTEITTTTVEDIGTLTASILSKDHIDESKDKVVFVGGETISYGKLADAVEGHLSSKSESGLVMIRERWSLEHLHEELKKEPNDALRKYRIIFGGKEGVAWPLSQTFNAQKGIPTQGVSAWLQTKQPFS